ncbi:MAG: hypothetical protein SGARI_003401 [Bacillariaceae sp.]
MVRRVGFTDKRIDVQVDERDDERVDRRVRCARIFELWRKGTRFTVTTSTEVTTLVRDMIASKAKVQAKNIPKFHCILETVSSTAGHKFKCQAYGISVRKSHYAAISSLLSKAFLDSPAQQRFVFYKMKHQNPAGYAKAVMTQAKITDSSRVVAIEGIFPDHMMHYAEHLHNAFPLAKAIYETPSTFQLGSDGRPRGRYNIL